MPSVTWFDSTSASAWASVWNLLTGAFRDLNEKLHPPGAPVDIGLERSLQQQPCGLNGTSVSTRCLWFSPHTSLHSSEFEHTAISKMFNIKEKGTSVMNIFIFTFFYALFLLPFFSKTFTFFITFVECLLFLSLWGEGEWKILLSMEVLDFMGCALESSKKDW